MLPFVVFNSAPVSGLRNNFDPQKWYRAPRDQNQKKRRKNGGFWPLFQTFKNRGKMEDTRSGVVLRTGYIVDNARFGNIKTETEKKCHVGQTVTQGSKTK